ncbi:Lsr2 family protein [Actinobaculum sp. 352]|uniref:histone-like nucleoid-structuring protein Lsr2 n=1 Tax=Actinobaculum sp. 352 TaxID=2490946 RepID=UPI000F7F35AC|nr:Lsr2 family protein [Actinobaculum sp. 352]RTE49072.1 Lsr2 family protein [Actinobaculum sp. 352]
MQKTVLIDDIDATTNDVQTITFALGKQSYEIDLGPENRQRLTDALNPFINHARRTRKPAPQTTRNAAQTSRKTIREWARNNGYTVAESGKLPADIINAYTHAQTAD